MNTHYNTHIMFRQLSLLLVFSVLFVSPLASAETEALSVEMLLPRHICIDDVVTFETWASNEASTMYRITTRDGGVLFQVVSAVVMETLPFGLQLVCLATIKHPSVCGYVHMAGKALIAVFGDGIMNRVESAWSTKVAGNKGIASVYSNTESEARDGMTAFQASRIETGYPWGSPVTEEFSDMSVRRGK